MNIENIQKKLNDKAFRAELRKNHQLVSEIDYNYDENIQYIIKTNTHNKIYLPIADSQYSEKIDLNQIQAAGTASTAGSLGTASTLCSCLNCVSSVGSAGSV